jgi:hypothetical protein
VPRTCSSDARRPVESLREGRHPRPGGFEWHEGNLRKSEPRHGIAAAEAAQALLNDPSQEEEGIPTTNRGMWRSELRTKAIAYCYCSPFGAIACGSSRRDPRAGNGERRMKKRKQEREAEIADYWLEHDSVPEIDWSHPGVRLEFEPGVERPTRSVTLRLPRRLLQELRVLAKGRGVPYQSFMKVLLADKVAELREKGGVVGFGECSCTDLTQRYATFRAATRVCTPLASTRRAEPRWLREQRARSRVSSRTPCGRLPRAPRCRRRAPRD